MTTRDTQKPLVQQASQHKRPPGPPAFTALQNTLAFRRDPITFLTQLTRAYGDICRFQLLTWPTVVLNHPDAVRRVYVERHQFYDKGDPFFQTARFLVGNGLGSADGEQWLRQRRLIQPLFHRKYLTDLGTIMVDTSQDLCQRWEAVENTEQPIQVVSEMENLNLRIVTQTIFRVDLNAQVETIGSDIDNVWKFLGEYFQMPFPPLSVPTTRHRHVKEVFRRLDSTVYSLIARRRASGNNGSDLLGLLLSARDEETGEGMSDQQVRDEIVTFFTAGSETSSLVLTWTWHLLSQHPDIEAALHQELDQVLAGRLPTSQDLSQLVYTRMILDEALRLYPPIWLNMRRAMQDEEICGYHIPKHAFVMYSPYILHRHPDFWTDPERFQPERFQPEQKKQYTSAAYVPFSEGPRLCIGQHFALMAMTLSLATIASRYRLVAVPGRPVELEPLLTLAPRHGLPMYIRSRASTQ